MDKTKRFECNIEGWKENFVVISTRWSKSDRATFWSEETTDEEFAVLLNNKLTSVSLEMVDGETLADSSEITATHLRETLPEVLTTWLYFQMAELMMELNSLGEAQRRRFLDTLVNQQTEPVADETQSQEPVSAEALTDASSSPSPTPS